MKAVVRQDILALLGRARIALDNEDADEMKRLSNTTIHNASVFQDQGSLSVAVVTYALAKLMERRAVDARKAGRMLQSAADVLKRKQEHAFRKKLRGMTAYLEQQDRKVRAYMTDVLQQAHLKKACMMCKHGVSVARAAELSSMTKWEVMPAVGRSAFSEDLSEKVSARERLQLARKLFVTP